MTSTLYLNGERVGDVFDFHVVSHMGNNDVRYIPSGYQEIAIPFTISTETLEAWKKVFDDSTSDAAIFEEFVQERGNLTTKNMRLLNVVSFTTTFDGKYDIISLVVFKDGSTWVQ